MARGVAEYVVRTGLVRGQRRYRVDLHGVSRFGPRGEHALIRWEWVESIATTPAGVVVGSASEWVSFPAGAFGLEADDLAARLEQARSIVHRADVIGGLAGEQV